MGLAGTSAQYPACRGAWIGVSPWLLEAAVPGCVVLASLWGRNTLQGCCDVAESRAREWLVLGVGTGSWWELASGPDWEHLQGPSACRAPEMLVGRGSEQPREGWACRRQARGARPGECVWAQPQCRLLKDQGCGTSCGLQAGHDRRQRRGDHSKLKQTPSPSRGTASERLRVPGVRTLQSVPVTPALQPGRLCEAHTQSAQAMASPGPWTSH